MKANIRKGWKVLRMGRLSCWIRGAGQVHYPINGWATPSRRRFGPLCVFKTESAAFDYRATTNRAAKLEFISVPCLYVPSKAKSVRLVAEPGVSACLRLLVDLKKSWPGTALANKVKCLK